MSSTDTHEEVRSGVRALCAQFPDEYFRKVDLARGYPTEFVDALTQAGWLAALIPHEYGGSGLSLAEASVIMEEINRSGGNSGVFIWGTPIAATGVTFLRGIEVQVLDHGFDVPGKN